MYFILALQSATAATAVVENKCSFMIECTTCSRAASTARKRATDQLRRTNIDLVVNINLVVC